MPSCWARATVVARGCSHSSRSRFASTESRLGIVLRFESMAGPLIARSAQYNPGYLRNSPLRGFYGSQFAIHGGCPTVSTPTLSAHDAVEDYEVLRDIENRILWLSTAIIDHANRVRPNPSGVKVGGHQASSASMVSIMTTLWFRH